jgi:hypothetical protein
VIGRAVLDVLENRRMMSRTIYVDAGAPVGVVHDGTSWTQAYTDLQQGLAAAVSGDQIRVADGTYKPKTGLWLPSATFQLKDGVGIYGGYAGYGAANADARDVAAYPTVLSGQVGPVGSYDGRSYHVVTGTGLGATTVLDGVTISAGRAKSGGGPSHGGGLYLTSSSLMLANCTFAGNVAEDRGGGMYALQSTVSLSGCVFDTNAAPYGGGLYADSSSMVLTDCTFVGNSNAPELPDVFFFPYGRGGGMYNSNSSATLTKCTFAANDARSPNDGYGGAIYNSRSSPTLTSCAFNGNTAIQLGGAVYNTDSSSPALVNCSFVANTAGGYVGSTIYGRGGAMYNVGSSSPTVTNSTFVANTAALDGSAVYSVTSSVPRITNSIFWANVAPTDAEIASGTGAGAIVTYCNVEGGYSGTGNINAEPKFVRKPWQGRYSFWEPGEADYGDLRLRAGSSGLDAGLNSAAAGIATDAAGNPRLQGNRVDMGAYEGATAAPSPAGVIYVDVNAVGANTGTTWTDAYTSLSAALKAAGNGGGEIRVADGVYRDGGRYSHSFALREGVAIYGGYAGYGAADPDARDVAAYPTVLTGEMTIGGLRYDAAHVVTAFWVDSSAVLDGVTVTGGNAKDNVLKQGGGGMYAALSAPTIRNVTFTGNTAFNSGGAVYNERSSPTFVGCSFVGNTADGAGMAYGGAMFGDGRSSPTVTNCTFRGNAALLGGAVYVSAGAAPVIANSLFVGNVAAASGAALHNSGVVSVINCTIVGNAANASGGAVYVASPSYATTIVNSIIRNNTGGSLVNNSSIYDVQVSYSAIQGGYAGIGNTGADPKFVRSPAIGADGKWGTADDDYGDLRLAFGSPAIDTGSNAAVPAGVTVDMAGNARLFDFPGAGTVAGVVVDMGAYELGMTVGLLNVATGQTLLLPAGGHVFTVETLVLAAGAKLDLKDSRLVLPYGAGVSPAADVAAWIAAGRNGGLWNGVGIFSSVAAADAEYATGVGYFDDGTKVTVRATEYGDANLDSRVDADDAAMMVLGKATGRTDWAGGNFNYRDGVNADDWMLFVRGAARTAASAQGPAAVSYASAFAADKDEVLGLESSGGMLALA